MKVKELTIQGFKSFAVRTRIMLHDGITVIVGPNGCGKSNVLDALRWVMGEQRPLQLRGRAMTDVIFNGSRRQKPAGLAEVHLAMAPGGGRDFPAPFNGFGELVISRRLYRSGDTEYALNRVPSRLKDVTAIFRDTGIGARGYAFIEQGQISQIITAKPTELRVMFEEAAGVSGFQTQRRESFRRITESEANLARLTDIIHEVARQLKTLKRQARQAEQFRALQQEERELDRQLYGHRFHDLTARLYPQRETVAASRKALAADEDRRRQLAAARQSADERRRELQRSVDGCRGTLEEHRHELQRTVSRQELLAQERRGLGEKLAEGERRRRGLQHRNDETASQQGELEADWRGLEAEIRTVVDRRRELEERCARAREHHGKLGREQAEVREKLFDLMRRESGWRNEIQLAREQRRRLEARAERLREEIEEHRDELGDGAVELEAVLAERERRQEERQRLTAELAAEQRRLAADEKQTAARQEQARRLHEELAVAERERLNLRRSVSEGHGFSAGMKEALDGESGRDGISPIWDVFTAVPPELEMPLEIFLRQVGEGLVLADRGETAAFADRQRRRRRVAALVPRRAAAAAAADQEQPPELPEETPSLAAYIEPLPAFRDAVGPLLARTFVVDDGPAALKLLDFLPPDAWLLTRSGEIYAGSGWFWVGEGQAGDAGELLALRRRLQDAEGRCAGLRQQSAAAEAELGRRRDDAARRRQALRDLQRRLEPVAAACDLVGRRVDELERQRQRLERLTGQLEDDLDGAGDELARLEVDESARAADLEAAAGRRGKMEGCLAWVVEQHGSAEIQLLQAQEELAEHKAVEARVAARRAHVGGERQRLAAEAERFRISLERLVRELAADCRREAEIDAELDQTAERRRELEAGCAADEKLLAGAQEELTRRDAELRQLDEWLQALDEGLEGRRGRLLEEELALKELESGCRYLQEQFAARYGESLGELLTADGILPLADDEERAAGRLAGLQERLTKFGEVNLLALQEAAAIEERHDFLREQEADLVASIRSVRAAIEKMERTSREQFLSTFHLVNDHFSHLFGELFEGGRASLRLGEEDEIWDAGVEISAAPPGKRLQNLRLFSGGEKALIAIALIFSFFRARPVPFCVLDEVDAPLDDANIGRFNQLVRSFARDSQFLMITHNRRTMAIGDTLYGITMEEDGVSKAVAVRLSDYTGEPQPLDEPVRVLEIEA